MPKRKKQKTRAPGLAEETPRTLFVCVRDRNGKGRSCAGSGSRLLVEDAKAILLRENIGPEELRIRPVGCLGLCERGPVCVAVAGAGALERKPSKLKKKRRRDAGALISIEVAPPELRGVLREALLRPADTA
jgi:predicted metal-binding protein